MSTLMREVVRTTLARSLYVAAAFAVTLIVFVLAGQTPDRSFWDWLLLGSILMLLSFVGGLLATFFELRQR